MRASQLKGSVFRNRDSWPHRSLQQAGRPADGHSIASDWVTGRKAVNLRGLLQRVFAYLHIPASHSEHRCDESLCHLHKNNKRILPQYFITKQFGDRQKRWRINLSAVVYQGFFLTRLAELRAGMIQRLVSILIYPATVLQAP